MTLTQTFNALYSDLHNAAERSEELCDSHGTLLEPVDPEKLDYLIKLTADAALEAKMLKRKLRNKT